MTDPVTISQYPQGFLGVMASQPLGIFMLVSEVAIVFLGIVSGITWLINVTTHVKRRPLGVDSHLYRGTVVLLGVFALMCAVGALTVDPDTKASNNFDTVSNAYGITISKPSDVMRVLRPWATAGRTPITFTDGDGKPQKGVLVRKGNKVTVYNNAANRLTPLKRAAR